MKKYKVGVIKKKKRSRLLLSVLEDQGSVTSDFHADGYVNLPPDLLYSELFKGKKNSPALFVFGWGERCV